MEQPRQIHVIAKESNAHDYLALSVVLAIICCCVSIPTLLCTLPAIAFAAAVSKAHCNFYSIYVCLHIYIHVCMLYACMYVCMHVYMYPHVSYNGDFK